jgi:hypothetical protein
MDYATPRLPLRQSLSLWLSAALWVLAGGTGVLYRWWPQDHSLAVRHGLLCMLLIGVLHWIGYLVFLRQGQVSLTPSIRRYLRGNLLAQPLLLFFAALVLDGGMLLSVFFVGCVGYWVLAALLLAKRAPRLTLADQVILAGGFFYAAVAAILIQWLRSAAA